ncbi:hypothetical protein IRM68_17990 (plasmid) [Erwinia amylovora]|nr:hypothetical protein IRM68_17990 [Erwinia amylovora]
MLAMFIIGLWAGGWFWLSVNGYQNTYPTLMTLINQGGIESLNDKAKEMLPWAWCFPVGFTFMPLILTLIVWLGAGSNKHRNLHGNARFATRQEIRKVLYTEKEK